MQSKTIKPESETEESETEEETISEQTYKQYVQDIIHHDIGLHIMPEDEYQRKQEQIDEYEKKHIPGM